MKVIGFCAAIALVSVLIQRSGAAPVNVPPELVPAAREGKRLFELGDYSGAERAYGEIVAKAPENVYAVSNLGVIQFRLGKLRLAEQSLRKAIALAPRDSFSHSTLAIVLYSFGRVDEALAEFNEALAIKADDVMALRYRGAILLQKGEYSAASEAFEKARLLDPRGALPGENPAPNREIIPGVTAPPGSEPDSWRRTGVGDFFTPLEQQRMLPPKASAK